MAELFVEVETNGIPRWERPADHPDQPHLVQIGAILYGPGGVEEGAYTAIIRPDGWTIPSGASRAHGITTERAIAQGVPLIEAMTRVGELHDRATVVACWGKGFDSKILRGAYRRAGLPDRDERGGGPPWYDCQRQVRAAIGDSKAAIAAAYERATGKPYVAAPPDYLDKVRELFELLQRAGAPA